MKNELAEKIENSTSICAIVGLGYVGLPLVEHLTNVGYKVIGFDIDPEKVEALKAGESYIKHIDAAWIQQVIGDGQFEPTTDFSRLAEADCVSICVPTPLDRNREPDLSFLENTTKEIAECLRPGQLIILESTTYPGTTSDFVKPLLEAGDLKAGQDFFLAYSAEREDPGNKQYNIQTIPKVVGGVTEDCAELTKAYYGRIFKEVIMVSSTSAAELTKLLENIFRCVNIALVNELKMLCDRMDIDVWEVINAAASKPFGYMPFYPGPGLGGHCIPIDPFYLSWKAREYDFQTRFIELAGEVNAAMPHYVIQRLMEELNSRRKPLNGSKVLILGVAYKKDVDDIRESPALKLIQLLQEHGADVEISDPHVPTLTPTRHYNFNMDSISLTPSALQACDAVVIVTDHSAVDYEIVVEHAQLVLDTRNATKDLSNSKENIVKA
jgi:UDP-N-acetyl-D-glucosamine dehydrogenase